MKTREYYGNGSNATVQILDPVCPPKENVGYFTWEWYLKTIRYGLLEYERNIK